MARDTIMVARGHPERVEELAAREPAAAAVLGEGVEVEGVVAGLGHLAVADELRAEEWVHWVQKPGPIGFAVDLAPHVWEVLLVAVVLL